MFGNFNKNLSIFVVSFSTAFLNFIPIYSDHLKGNNYKEDKNTNSSIFEPMSVGVFPETTSLIKFKIANNIKRRRIFNVF